MSIPGAAPAPALPSPRSSSHPAQEAVERSRVLPGFADDPESARPDHRPRPGRVDGPRELDELGAVLRRMLWEPARAASLWSRLGKIVGFRRRVDVIHGHRLPHDGRGARSPGPTATAEFGSSGARAHLASGCIEFQTQGRISRRSRPPPGMIAVQSARTPPARHDAPLSDSGRSDSWPLADLAFAIQRKFRARSHPNARAFCRLSARHTAADFAAKRTSHGWYSEKRQGQSEATLRNKRTESCLTPALCLSGQRRAKVTKSPQLRPALGSPCASDDLPHTIPYHGGLRLSSPSRPSLSYQPVACCPKSGRRLARNALPSRRAVRCRERKMSRISATRAGKERPGLQTARPR